MTDSRNRTPPSGSATGPGCTAGSRTCHKEPFLRRVPHHDFDRADLRVHRASSPPATAQAYTSLRSADIPRAPIGGIASAPRSNPPTSPLPPFCVNAKLAVTSACAPAWYTGVLTVKLPGVTSNGGLARRPASRHNHTHHHRGAPSLQRNNPHDSPPGQLSRPPSCAWPFTHRGSLLTYAPSSTPDIAIALRWGAGPLPRRTQRCPGRRT